MRGKKKLLIPVILAIGVYLLINFSLSSTNKRINNRDNEINKLKQELTKIKKTGNEVVNKVNVKRIVVAKKYIKSGTKITADMLKSSQLESNLITDDYFKSMNSVVNSIIAKDIKPGEPILKTMIIEMEFTDFHLPIGMRAVSVPLEYILGLASYHKVGSKIDIISTIKNKDNKLPMTVQNSTILAIEKKIVANKTSKNQSTATKKAGSISSIRSITFEIPATKSSEFVNAIVNGRIQLVSRSSKDTKMIQTEDALKKEYIAPPVDLKTIQNTEIGELPDPMIPEYEPSTRKVELIQANVKSEIEFNDD